VLTDHYTKFCYMFVSLIEGRLRNQPSSFIFQMHRKPDYVLIVRTSKKGALVEVVGVV